MKKYRVNVNGTAYEVEIELIDANAVASAPAKEAAPAAAPAPTAAPAGGQAINAPMPGTILKVNVQNGQAVKKGDVLMILEAMKMENEIMAPCDGTVAGVAVAQGATVWVSLAVASSAAAFCSRRALAWMLALNLLAFVLTLYTFTYVHIDASICHLPMTHFMQDGWNPVSICLQYSKAYLTNC